MQSVAVGDMLYGIGGVGMNTMECIDTKNPQKWHTIPLLGARGQHCTVADNNSIYVLGGYPFLYQNLKNLLPGRFFRYFEIYLD